jgi:pimeloyl-ACP methyl ester carboxylesterase
MMPVSEFRELNGLRHHLLRWEGPPDAPTLVMLHGFLDLAWSFQPFAEQLSQLLPLRIVGLDLRGHGRTEWVGRGGYYHFADYVADVHALLQTMPGPVFLLGHSMGGSVSSLVAGSFPTLVRKLVLVEGGIGPAGDPGEPPDRMVDWITQVQERRRRPPRPMASRAEAEARLRQSNPRMTSAMAALLAEQGTTGVEGGIVWSFDPLHRTRSPVPYSMDQYRTFLARIAAPTLFVAGLESDLKHLVDDADYMQRLAAVRQLRLVEIAKAGHMIHQDQPRQLATEVAKFLMEG